MSDPFIAEVRIFAGEFPIRDWAYCDGQLLPIAQNAALFSLIGTTYGGDGLNTTGLPNLMGRAPMGAGLAPGLTYRPLGERIGMDRVTLNQNEIPSHNHSLRTVIAAPGTDTPSSTTSLSVSRRMEVYKQTSSLTATMSSEALNDAGGGQAHENRQPLLVLNFIIALTGLYPSRS